MATVNDPPKEDLDENYNSASDEDFNPDTLPTHNDDDASSSSSDDDGTTPSSITPIHKHESKRKASPTTTREDLDFNNSGDEATISRSLRKRKKRKTTNDEDEDEDNEGGEGGLIKTRAQRKAEGATRKPLVQASKGSGSVDVDALWASMSKGSVAARTSTAQRTTQGGKTATKAKSNIVSPQDPTIETSTNRTPAPSSSSSQPTITITRTYAFAGETHTETRTVAADSEEAKLYRAQQDLAISQPPAPADTGLRRPKKRASMFDAMPVQAAAGKGPKLNTIQKSKLDWAQHVDREGMSEELDEAKRAKGGYLGKVEFLGRMDARRQGG